MITAKNNWLVLLAISLVCLLAYANSFQNHFMLDDNIVIFGQQGVLYKSFPEIFTSYEGDFYRPIGLVPLWLSSHLLGANYTGYHAVNLFLFVFVCFLFFVIVRKITSDATLALLSALLYAIHPFNAMLINYITASALAVFVLSVQMSFLFFMYYSERGLKRDYILSLIFFVFACLSHEMAIMLPVYLAAYLFFIRKESRGRMLRLLWPFAAVLFVWFALRVQNSYVAQHLHKSFSSGNIAASFSTWMELVIWYITNLFFPSKIIFLWSHPYGQEHLWRNAVIFVLALGLGAYAFFQWKRSWKSFLLMVFVSGFLPTVFSCFANFPKIWPLIEPHWFYFSQIGFFVLSGWFILKLARDNIILGGLFGGSVMLLLFIFCWSYNAQWQTQEKYSLYWLSLNKGNMTPYFGLGRSLMDRGDYRDAINIYWSAQKHLNLVNVELGADWAHCLDMLGYDKEALSWLNAAVRIDSHYPRTYYYLGLYYKKKGNFAEAQRTFKELIALDPKFLSEKTYE